MTRLHRIGPLVVAGGLLGACGQLIGLNQFDTTDGAAGEKGTGGAAGKGGSGGGGGNATTGGKGGSTGGKGGTGGRASTGGAAGMSAGGSSGKSGSGAKGGSDAGGASGEGGAATGGTTGGKGGAGGKGGGGGKGGSTPVGGEGGGGAGVPGCSETIEIATAGAPEPYVYATSSSYWYNVNPQIETAAVDYLWIDFWTGGEYDGELVGQSFQLGTGADDNYASCSRCVWFGVDVGDSGDVAAYFFAKSGTMQVDSDSDQLNGYPDIHLKDVLLSEVTIKRDTHVSHEIVGGRCLHITSADLVIKNEVPVVPPEWTCAASGYGTYDGCDCGCGAHDPDCNTAYSGECYYCYEDGGCGEAGCTNIKVDDNAHCTAATQPWTCDTLVYGDAFLCDCGCGVVDPDCFDATASSCALCDDANSCAATAMGDCAVIDPTDNSKCMP